MHIHILYIYIYLTLSPAADLATKVVSNDDARRIPVGLSTRKTFRSLFLYASFKKVAKLLK
jgi:hypothetical protein